MSATASAVSPAGSDARERIMEAAYDLFSRQGIRAVGIDAIVERSGVARMTLYRHFPSKNALALAFLEMADPAHELHRASTDYLARIRAFVEGLAAEAGVPDPDDFARQWHILMKGSIVAAGEGDRWAARRAREVGALLLREKTAVAS